MVVVGSPLDSRASLVTVNLLDISYQAEMDSPYFADLKSNKIPVCYPQDTSAMITPLGISCHAS